ncbi:hypothetical protein HRbin28_02178 [bacterium HR28]|nr:hypothetical protein HRbin28_02178 [bacterium HR28]
MAEETFRRVIPRGTRLRQLLDVEIPGDPPDGSLLLWDAAQGRWVARQITVPAHTHAPADITPQGSGSGLDADLLDGQHASAFAAAGHHHDGTYVKKTGDTMSGTLTIDTGTAGSSILQVRTSATSQYSTAGIEFYHGAPVSAQRDIRFFLENAQAGGGGNANLFLRHQRGSWPDARNILVYNMQTEELQLSGSNLRFLQSPAGSSAGSETAYQIWHAGNDGAGSGLDADLLDGKHASDFAPASHTHPPQNTFATVKVGATNLVADAPADVLELAAGAHVTLTPDAANDKVTIAVGPQGSGSGLDADLLDGQHASAFAPASHTHPDATTTTSGFLSAGDKAKLDGIQPGAEVNQNAFSGVKVGSITIAATQKTDTIELVAGSNVTLTPDAANKKVTIAASGGSSVNSYGVVQVGSTNVAATVPGDTVKLAAGSNVTLTPDAATKQVTIAVSPQGSGSGLHADLLDGYHASALQNQNAFSNVAVGSTTIAASTTTDTLNLSAGSNISLAANTSTKTVTITVSPQGAGSGLHADLLDGYHAGNSSNQVPVSNGTLCNSLNADLVDGYHASSFLLTSGGSISGNLSVSGYVTIGNRPFLFRGKTTSQSIAANTTTVVSFPNAVSQTGPGNWNSTSNFYTVGLAGLYLVSVSVLLNAATGGGRVSLRVRKGGTEYYVYDQNIDTSDYVLASGQILLPCAVNDTIDVVIWCSTSRSTYSEGTAGTFNRLQIVFLG